MKHTKAIDGYRWELRTHVESPAFCNWTGFSAIPQKRGTTDSGRVYYRYCEPEARFSTLAERDAFLANFTAKDWATE